MLVWMVTFAYQEMPAFAGGFGGGCAAALPSLVRQPAVPLLWICGFTRFTPDLLRLGLRKAQLGRFVAGLTYFTAGSGRPARTPWQNSRPSSISECDPGGMLQHWRRTPALRVR